MIYVTFEKYTNRKGKIGTANRVFSSKSKAIKYALSRANSLAKKFPDTDQTVKIKAHRGSWVA